MDTELHTATSSWTYAPIVVHLFLSFQDPSEVWIRGLCSGRWRKRILGPRFSLEKRSERQPLTQQQHLWNLFEVKSACFARAF